MIFAQDRRKKKARNRAVLFFIAVFFLAIGIMLTLKNKGSDLQLAEGNQIIFLDELDDSYPEEVEGSLLGEDLSLIAAIQHDLEQVINLPEDVTIESSPVQIIDTIENTTQAILPEKEEDESESEIAENTPTQEDEKATDYNDSNATTKQADALPQSAQQALDNLLDVADQALRIQNQFSYSVTRGDRLRDVLGQSGLSARTATNLIKRFPELNTLNSGQQFYWILNRNGDLEYMNWLVSEKEERIYERRSNGSFAMRKIEKKGEWRQDVVRGTLTSGFAQSLKAVGLSDRQIQQLARGLQSQIATQKLRKGDRFAILVKREYINGKVTDLGNVEGIHIRSGNKSYYAIQAANGRYYSAHGETLGSGSGFARQPFLFTARVSSSFNPHRRHPITKRVRPHNGTDFAVPIGTPIIAPSDGIVEHVAYQAKGAGRYIRIRHGHITTVYMHLSKSLVKVGQAVKKGDRIALSGNTGGSTGPHLHYEFHINGQPVNPMTVKLPGNNAGMADKERKNFLARANFVKSKLKL